MVSELHMNRQREHHVCAHIRVKLISRSVKAHDKSARIMVGWDNVAVVRPQARIKEGVLVGRRSYETLRLIPDRIGRFATGGD